MWVFRGHYPLHRVKVLFTTFEVSYVVVFRCFFALQTAQETKVALSCKNTCTFFWAYKCPVQPLVLFIAKYGIEKTAIGIYPEVDICRSHLNRLFI
jgi:hypothetical protein